MNFPTEGFLNYIKFEKKLSAHTILAYSGDVSEFIHFCENNLSLTTYADVGFKHVRMWQAQLTNEKKEVRTIRRKLSSLKAYFRFLQKDEKLEVNPVAKINRPKLKERLPVVVPIDKLQFLFNDYNFGDTYTDILEKTVLELLYSTGLRRSELVNLKLNDIDFGQNFLKVTGKRNKQRIIPFAKTLDTTLSTFIVLRQKTISIPSDFLFITEKNLQISDGQVYAITKKYLGFVTTQAKRSPHVLRHSFATHLSENGAEINAIKDLLGHANLAATQVYLHNTSDRLKKVYQQAHPKSGDNSESKAEQKEGVDE